MIYGKDKTNIEPNNKKKEKKKTKETKQDFAIMGQHRAPFKN